MVALPKLNHLSAKIRVDWHNRVLHIRETVTLSDVQVYLKSTLFVYTKFRVPILDHSEDGKVVPNLVMDEGWRVIDPDKICDAKWVRNVYENDAGEKVSHYVFWSKFKSKAENG